MLSCNQGHPAVKARIDKVISVLDSTNLMTAKIDFEAEEANAQKIKSDMEFIQANFKDTLTHSMGYLLSDYHALLDGEEEEEKKQAGKEQYEIMLKKELDYTKKQLLNLRHDAENTDVTIETLNKYLEAESTAVFKLNDYVKHKQLEFERKNNQFKLLQPKVQAFIDSLKKW